MSSSRSPLPIDALVSPSVTYTPKRPSLATTGRWLTGSVPNSRSGPGGPAGAAALVHLRLGEEGEGPSR